MLNVLLGRSEGPGRQQDEGGCGTYDLISWSTIQVFFTNGQLVGYNTGYTPSKKVSTFETAQGLRIGDTIADAERIYGSALHDLLGARRIVVFDDGVRNPDRSAQRYRAGTHRTV